MATRRQTVAKIAISMPRDVLKEVDRVAREQKITRSSLITRALMHSLTKYRDEEIARQINRALADPRTHIDEAKETRYWNRVYKEWIKKQGR